MSHFSNSPSHSSARVRSPPLKRHRVTRACDHCKSRKRRCNGEIPCRTCIQQGWRCTYNANYSRGKIPSPKPALTHSSGRSGGSNAPFDPNFRPASPAVADSSSTNGQYIGPSSSFSFLRRAWTRFGRHDGSEHPNEEDGNDLSIFLVGDRRLPNADSTAYNLPDRTTTNLLFRRYFDYAVPTYRFFHEPTTFEWLEALHRQQEQPSGGRQLSMIRHAIVLLILATASVYLLDAQADVHDMPTDDVEQTWKVGETLFQVAQHKIVTERGRACTESVQARILAALFLLNTSRPNQAWYTLGTTIQLAIALGMHRRRPGLHQPSNYIDLECKKRCFWSIYLLDVYLSNIFGRPALLHDGDIDCNYPTITSDEDLTAEGICSTAGDKDCVIEAAIHHLKLARILKAVSAAQTDGSGPQEQHLLESVRGWYQQLDDWKRGLPPFLAGAVRPSTLIAAFRRQPTVLRLACLHATMLASRPLLLSLNAASEDVAVYIDHGVDSAREMLEAIVDMVKQNAIFPANWTFQYFTFHALSIVYVWIIQYHHGRVAAEDQDRSERLYTLAEEAQGHLAVVTRSNAPGLKYSIVLEELQQEAKRLLKFAGRLLSPILETSSNGVQTAITDSHSLAGANVDWNSLRADFPMDPDLWLQMNTFPLDADASFFGALV